MFSSWILVLWMLIDYFIMSKRFKFCKMIWQKWCFWLAYEFLRYIYKSISNRVCKHQIWPLTDFNAPAEVATQKEFNPTFKSTFSLYEFVTYLQNTKFYNILVFSTFTFLFFIFYFFTVGFATSRWFPYTFFFPKCCLLKQHNSNVQYTFPYKYYSFWVF